MNVIAMRRPQGEASVPPEDDGELGTISLKWLFAFLVRRWILIAITAAVVFIAAFTGLMIQKPQYTATSLVMISAGQEIVLNPQQQMNGANVAPPAQLVDSQLEVLRS